MRFSKAEKCFYPEDIEYGHLPDDLIDVPHDVYEMAVSRPPGATLDVVDGAVVVVSAPEAQASERLTAAVASALASLNGTHAVLLQRLSGSPYQAEKDTWQLKVDAAAALLDGRPASASATSFMEALGLATEADRLEWAESVQSKAVEYGTAVGKADRWRSQARAAIQAADDEESLAAALAEQLALADALTVGAATI